MRNQNSVDEYDQSVIRAVREEKRWSRRELAEKSGITQQTILNVEQNRFPASLSTLTAITEALGINFTEYIELSHRCKTSIIDHSQLKVEPYSGYCLLSYEYNDYIVLQFDINEPFDKIFMSQLPYFDIVTYVLDGTLKMSIDDKEYLLKPNHAIKYSGLTSRYFSCDDRCNFLSVLKRKPHTQHHYNPSNELQNVLESYTRQAISNKPVPVNPDNMDFTIIKQLRNMHCMSLEKLAEESGMSTSAISLIENNKRAPSLATLSSIAGVLGNTPVNLYHLAKKCSTEVFEPVENKTLFSAEDFTLHDTNVDNIMFNFFRTKDRFSFGQLVKHPFCIEVQVPVTGTLSMDIEEESYSVRPGQMLVFDGNRQHKYSISESYKGLIIRIPKTPRSKVGNITNETESVQ